MILSMLGWRLRSNFWIFYYIICGMLDNCQLYSQTKHQETVDYFVSRHFSCGEQLAFFFEMSLIVVKKVFMIFEVRSWGCEWSADIEREPKIIHDAHVAHISLNLFFLKIVPYWLYMFFFCTFSSFFFRWDIRESVCKDKNMVRIDWYVVGVRFL